MDDEDAILTMEKLMLERLGYHVTSRTSSMEALEAFRDSPDKFNLVITDMAMPNMPGDKLSVELTKVRPDIPVLLCTGFSETMSEGTAASLGIKGFLLKPIVMKDLSQKIREVLNKMKHFLTLLATVAIITGCSQSTVDKKESIRITIKRSPDSRCSIQNIKFTLQVS